MKKPYRPTPLDTSSVELPAEMVELTEKLAKNIHEVWALQRMTDGWRYGPRRNDRTKEHPCLIPYEELPEAEKDYDRNTALETLKTITLFGFKTQRQ